jgi:hypothetical protein
LTVEAVVVPGEHVAGHDLLAPHAVVPDELVEAVAVRDRRVLPAKPDPDLALFVCLAEEVEQGGVVALPGAGLVPRDDGRHVRLVRPRGDEVALAAAQAAHLRAYFA